MVHNLSYSDGYWGGGLELFQVTTQINTISRPKTSVLI